MPAYLEVKAMKGACPVCHASLGEVPVTELRAANTASAGQLFRGYGHLVVLSGTTWLMRCEKDAVKRLVPAPGVGPVAVSGSPAVSAAAATQRPGTRRT